jgi:hypothetical protein
MRVSLHMLILLHKVIFLPVPKIYWLITLVSAEVAETGVALFLFPRVTSNSHGRKQRNNFTSVAILDGSGIRRNKRCSRSSEHSELIMTPEQNLETGSRAIFPVQLSYQYEASSSLRTGGCKCMKYATSDYQPKRICAVWGAAGTTNSHIREPVQHPKTR